MNPSGNPITRAPLAPASRISRQAFSVEPSRSRKTDAACTAATFTTSYTSPTAFTCFVSFLNSAATGAFPEQLLPLHHALVEPPRRAQHHAAVLEAHGAHLVAADAARIGRGVDAGRQRGAVECVVAGVGHELAWLARRQRGAAVAQHTVHPAVRLKADHAVRRRPVGRRQRLAVVIDALSALEMPGAENTRIDCSHCA